MTGQKLYDLIKLCTEIEDQMREITKQKEFLHCKRYDIDGFTVINIWDLCKDFNRILRTSDFSIKEGAK